jgi:predicted permease
MCLIFTIVAAVAFSVAFFATRKTYAGGKSVATAALMFWAAALMWSVDGIASVLGGEGFFDLSREDAVLGTIIVASGLLAFGLLRLLERRKPQGA